MASTTKQMNITAGNAQATVNATVNDSMPAIPCPDPAGYRYVGARYVPLFADPLQWNSANTYEPLTIVVNEGNSYTSRTFVPVGIDIENKDYWALTGNYNAQIEQYREEVQQVANRVTKIEDQVDTINTEIDDINSKLNKAAIVVIGDSWSAAQNWQNALSSTYTFKTYAVGGAGYVTTAYTPKTFTSQFSTMLNDITSASLNPDTIKMIVVYGGVNDYRMNVSEQDVSTAMINLYNSYKSQSSLKNVPIRFVFSNIGNPSIDIPSDGTATATTWNHFTTWLNTASLLAKRTGVPVYDKAHLWTTGYLDMKNFIPMIYNSDNLHPTQMGYNLIASYMRQIIEGGDPDIHYCINTEFDDEKIGHISLQEEIFNGTLSFNLTAQASKPTTINSIAVSFPTAAFMPIQGNNAIKTIFTTYATNNAITSPVSMISGTNPNGDNTFIDTVSIVQNDAEAQFNFISISFNGKII